MSIFDRMIDAMNIASDDDDMVDEYFDDDIDKEDAVDTPKRSVAHARRRSQQENMTPDASSRPLSNPKITPMRPSRSTQSSGMEVCVIKPSAFEDSKEVIDTILSNRPVIMNLEGLDLSLAQRIIDVISGACLALDGTLQKISSYIFIVTPSSVDISGDLQGIMDSFDISGIQTAF